MTVLHPPFSHARRIHRAVRRSILPPRAWRAPIAFAALAALTACGADSPTAPTPTPPRGIVVLDGFIQPGLTLLADSATTGTKLAFASPTEFDAGGFSLLRDTVLAVSSRGAGDLLYIADLAGARTERFQLPARSNPGRARLFAGGNGRALIAAALRDSSAVALVSVVRGGTPTITRISNAGTCPTDMFQHGTDTWIVDANSNCRVNYAVQGPVRLIRVPATGTTRDTLVLTGLRGSGASAIVDGDVAYVSAGGEASFASFPYTLVASGAVAKVDLRARRVLTTRPMPAPTYGAGVKLGLDGFLYVSLYQDLTTFTNRIIRMRADDLSFAPNGTTPWLSLVDAGGQAVNCGSGVADALGRLHCLVSGAGSTTSLVVFSPSFVELRRVAAGQGGVDLALR